LLFPWTKLVSCLSLAHRQWYWKIQFQLLTRSCQSPRLPAVLRGWCKGWKIIRRQEGDTRKEKPTTKFKTTYQTWASQWFNTDRNDSKSRDQSLSLDQVLSVPLMQTRAKVSIEIMADQFALEHMWLSLLYTMRQQEETRMYCKKIEYPNHTTRMYCKKK
jgi:hypothetical protein